MRPKRKRKLLVIIIGVCGLAVSTTLVLLALSKNIDLYYTPSQALAAHLKLNKNFRLGGLVKKGSVIRDPHSLLVSFILTDYKHRILVTYYGVLPTLFREGQGIIASGHIKANGVFEADNVLAKHDENYKPPNIH